MFKDFAYLNEPIIFTDLNRTQQSLGSPAALYACWVLFNMPNDTSIHVSAFERY